LRSTTSRTNQAEVSARSVNSASAMLFSRRIATEERSRSTSSLSPERPKKSTSVSLRRSAVWVARA
jgi:hypothetical protein